MTAKEFIETLPSKVNAEALTGMDTVFHFDLDGGAMQKTVKVENGHMTILDGLQGAEKCKITAKSETLMRIVRGEENPTMAVMMGKIKISNLGEMMKFAPKFGLM